MDPNIVHKYWNAYLTNLKNNSENAYICPPEFGTSLRASGVQYEINVTTSQPRSVSEEYVADNIKL